MSTRAEGAALVELACAVARAAGDLLRESAGAAAGTAATEPAAPGAPATASATPATASAAAPAAGVPAPEEPAHEVDVACERLIVDRLLAARPDDAILGEEGGPRPGTSGVRWIIDPLDGSLNHARGLPAYAVSIAAEVAGTVVAGVVHAPAGDGRTYTAVRGRGAFCDGRRLTASRRTRLAEALVGTGFGHDPARRGPQAALIATLAGRVLDIRHGGSAALDLCHVAAGRLDLYCEYDTRPWDRAAGILIAEEAGAAVEGRRPGPATDELVIAGSAPLVAAVRTLLPDAAS